MSNILAASYLILTSAIVPTKLSSPEQTLDNYINCLRIGSEQCVLNYYYGIDSFYIPGPNKIDYEITNKITMTKKDVDEWNRTMIKPKAQVGDIRLITLEKGAGAAYGDNGITLDYYLRKYDDTWLIYALAGAN